LIAGRILAAACGSAMLLSGCATIRGERPGGELVGRTLSLQTASGEVSTLRFRSDGTVRAAFARGSVTGRWQAGDRNLCFFWSGAPRECWPYREPFVRGRTRAITSDRGNVVRVTML
jgi:hypothetical protein